MASPSLSIVRRLGYRRRSCPGIQGRRPVHGRKAIQSTRITGKAARRDRYSAESRSEIEAESISLLTWALCCCFCGALPDARQLALVTHRLTSSDHDKCRSPRRSEAAELSSDPIDGPADGEIVPLRAAQSVEPAGPTAGQPFSCRPGGSPPRSAPGRSAQRPDLSSVRPKHRPAGRSWL